jgi:AAHS family 4-hydroxybenzoate transporter-like MFS transporter
MPISKPIDVQAFLNAHKFSAYQWLIFFLCFMVVLLDGFDTAAIGYIAPSLIKDWGVTKPMLAPVLSAALFGLAAGALLSGPIADRLGRKRVLTVTVLLFGVATLASAFATNLTELSVLRFITGLGLGSAMPSAVTLMSEYCPTARRSTLTNLMFCGFPLGAAFGGFLAAWMIPQWGWQSVLVLGGIAPLVLTVGLLTLLPESVRFMVTRRQPVERIRAALARIAGPQVHQIERFTLSGADTLKYQFTVDDPASFAQSWSGESVLTRTGALIYEYACHEANYSLTNVMRGRRSVETAGATKG